MVVFSYNQCYIYLLSWHFFLVLLFRCKPNSKQGLMERLFITGRVSGCWKYLYAVLINFLLVNYPCLCAANSLSLSSIIFVIISLLIRCIKAKNNIKSNEVNVMIMLCLRAVFQFLYYCDISKHQIDNSCSMKQFIIFHVSNIVSMLIKLKQ